jgi:hypothetical protein
MRQIGIDLPLFPDDLYLLGDKIYPNRHPIMTYCDIFVANLKAFGLSVDVYMASLLDDD